MANKQTVNMCEGNLLKNMLLYSAPLMATGLLQLLYNAADIIVVARWSGPTALAAVGSNGPLINLIINVFMGISVGASVIVSRYYGAKDTKNLHDSVHCAIALSIVSGLVTMVLGLLVADSALRVMSTPADVIGQASLYLKIYFLGMPAIMVYNFGASILRAVGDTKRPLYILMASGIINVVLNLVLVIVFSMGVAGVAIATTVSQIISAACVLICLMRSSDIYKLEFRKIKIHRHKMVLMLKNGIPAGLQGSTFSLSNIVIQSSINSFGSAVMSGSSAASNVEGFVYIVMNAFHHTCLAFTSQNIGAGNLERIKKVFRLSMLLVIVVGIIVGCVVYIFGEELLSLYTSVSGYDSSVTPQDIIDNGMVRLKIICLTYFFCGMMEVVVGALRGMGSPMLPMIVSIVGVCGVRLVWIFTVFNIYRSPESLYISYTISWIITTAVHYICYRITSNKLLKSLINV